jgi:putative tryptophan/tyrosine transport system substrate-binding protein
MRRRKFIAVVGGAAAALPLAALAQRQTPLVGFLNSASPDTYRFNADSFREGLAKAGFIEDRNVRIEERWARGDYGVLPALAAELIVLGVAAIAATGDAACEQHGTRGVYYWRRPGPPWTGRKHKPPRQARDRHPF